MDEGKGGQKRGLQEREGENRKQSANLVRNEKEKKKRDQPGQGDSGLEKETSPVKNEAMPWTCEDCGATVDPATTDTTKCVSVH